VRYRRARQSGGTFFFTVVTADRRPFLCEHDHPTRLRAAIEKVRAARPFAIDALVMLPDHLHCIWTLPGDDADFSTRWMLIKGEFSRGFHAPDARSPGRPARRERAVWQSRFWEHCIRDEDDLSRHVDYVHFNPVKHGYVPRAEDWAFSSIHRYVRIGVYSAGWASDPGTMPVSE